MTKNNSIIKYLSEKYTIRWTVIKNKGYFSEYNTLMNKNTKLHLIFFKMGFYHIQTKFQRVAHKIFFHDTSLDKDKFYIQ